MVVRDEAGARLAEARDLRHEIVAPMSRLTLRDGSIDRENLWPTDEDLGRPVDPARWGGWAAQVLVERRGPHELALAGGVHQLRLTSRRSGDPAPSVRRVQPEHRSREGEHVQLPVRVLAEGREALHGHAELAMLRRLVRRAGASASRSTSAEVGEHVDAHEVRESYCLGRRSRLSPSRGHPCANTRSPAGWIPVMSHASGGS